MRASIAERLAHSVDNPCPPGAIGDAWPMASLGMPGRLVQLLAGLLLYGVSIAIYVRAGLGLDPWDVFHQGLARHTGVSFGVMIVIVSVIVLGLWIPLRARLGIGTIANAILVGVFADLALGYIGTPHGLATRLPLLVAAVVGNGIATGLYIGSGLGAGPRDGLTMALVARFGWPIRWTRMAIELGVLAIGIALGGTFGVGTVLYALMIGPLMHMTVPLFSRKRDSEPVPATACTIV